MTSKTKDGKARTQAARHRAIMLELSQNRPMTPKALRAAVERRGFFVSDSTWWRDLEAMKEDESVIEWDGKLTI